MSATMNASTKTTRTSRRKKTTKKPSVKKPRAKRSRQELIADAVIEVLGRAGARGLTHREIDRFLRLPDGSTSYYFRRKDDLIAAGLERLNALTLERHRKRYETVFQKAASKKQVKLSDFAETEFETYKQYISSPPLYRNLARVEFFIMAIRDKSLMEAQRRTMQPIFDLDEKMFRLLGAKNPRHAAAEYGDFRRGSFMTFVLVPNAVFGRDRTIEYYENVIRKIIADTDKMQEDLPLDANIIKTIAS
ncbi:TetR/AcrR family transcriptional regulator [Hyphococcus luteus]|uniref:HTH tetR-type domain-containing protein n=1 Tax=Hyphococcus luteus TaxID=2058213 RepID=A0A2S7K596_9PROT|nr:hypothetical protein [Marinicaulis flavus]PQA87646.1 hypothetical protein CW354_11255 [Marinicaulis flavus]